MRGNFYGLNIVDKVYNLLKVKRLVKGYRVA